MNTLALTETNFTNISNSIEKDMTKLRMKHSAKLWEICKNHDASTAMKVISVNEKQTAEMRQQGLLKTSNKYVTISTLDLLVLMIEMGLEFTWDLDWYEKTDKWGNQFTGKHRVIVYPNVDTGILSHNENEAFGALAVYILNSYDGTMRLSLFAGWLVWLCLNGMFGGDVLKLSTGENAWLRQIHKNVTPEEVYALTRDLAQSVITYVENEEYKALEKQIEYMTNHNISSTEQETIAKKVIEERIKLQPFYTNKFVENGGSIHVSGTHLEDFMTKVNKIARDGHHDNSIHSFQQRLQEAVGANNSIRRSNDFRRIVERVDYKKSIHNDEGSLVTKDCHIRSLQLSNQRDIANYNLLITDLFNNLLPEEEFAA